MSVPVLVDFSIRIPFVFGNSRFSDFDRLSVPDLQGNKFIQLFVFFTFLTRALFLASFRL